MVIWLISLLSRVSWPVGHVHWQRDFRQWVKMSRASFSVDRPLLRKQKYTKHSSTRRANVKKNIAAPLISNDMIIFFKYISVRLLLLLEETLSIQSLSNPEEISVISEIGSTNLMSIHGCVYYKILWVYLFIFTFYGYLTKEQLYEAEWILKSKPILFFY